MNSFRVAARRLIATPVFAMAAIATLALGIGANSLAFGAMHGLLLRPLPFTDADRLAYVFVRPVDRDANSLEPLWGPEATLLATRMKAFASTAVIGDRGLVMDGPGRFVQWQGLWVTPGLFAVLDVAPSAGRSLGVEDMNRSGPPAMMISYERWTQDFAGDPAIVGRAVDFADNKRFLIVGVLPAGLEFPLARAPQAGNGSGFRPGVQDFWILGQNDPREYPGGTFVARLASGTTFESAANEIQALAMAASADLPVRGREQRFELVSFRDHALGVLAPALPVLQLFAALVLIIACGNLANLMLGRADRLELDDAIRVALGAGRAVRVQMLLAESLLLCVIGSAMGLMLAWSAQAWLRQTAASFPHIAARLEVSVPVLIFTIALCALVTVLFTLIPASVRVRQPLAVRLGAGGSRLTRRRVTAWRTSLIVVQVTLAVALLAGAILLQQSLHRLLNVDAGYRPERVVTADVTLFVPGREVYAFYERLHSRLRSLPGIEAVGLIQSTPLTGKWTFTEPFRIDAAAAPAAAPEVAGSFVAYDYFEAMDIPMLAGRTFTAAELTAPNPPLIINDRAAEMFFPGTNPIGHRVRLAGRRLHEIVGVVKGTRDMRLDLPAVPQWYLPGMFGDSQLIVRTSGDSAAWVATLRRELLAADPRLIVKRVEPLDDVVAAHVVERQLTSRLLDGFAAIAFAIALTGVGAALWLTVVERRREFALRLALGAQRHDLLRLVMRHGVWVCALGVVAGTLLTLWTSRVLQRMLFEISPTDPATLAGAAAVVMAVAWVACLAPAWKAATVDPLRTLRQV